jgi:hypothetical protein
MARLTLDSLAAELRPQVATLTARVKVLEAAAEPPQPPAPPASGLVWDDDFRSFSLYHPTKNPTGRYRPNFPYGADGEVHTGQYPGLWPDKASSRMTAPTDQPFVFIDSFYAPDLPVVHKPVAGGGLDLLLIKNPKPSDARTINPDNGKKGSYLGSLITTSESLRQQYGRFEATMTLTNVPGSFPAFWLWDESGEEIDVMEQVATVPGRLWQHTHNPDFQGLPVNDVDWAKPHTHAVEWRKDRIKWLLDGGVIQDIANPGIHKPKFLLINHAAGGWDGNDKVADSKLPATIRLHRLQVWA